VHGTTDQSDLRQISSSHVCTDCQRSKVIIPFFELREFYDRSSLSFISEPVIKITEAMHIHTCVPRTWVL
jgi:hypothetical protein